MLPWSKTDLPMKGIPDIRSRGLFRFSEINPFHSIGNSPLLDKQACLWFAYARQALKFGLEALDIGRWDKILVPAYICNVIESPLVSLGIKPTYYEINADLSPNFADIERRLDRKTKALLYVNYFGYPAPFEKIRAFCKSHDLFYIEDNAHGFLSMEKVRCLGTIGDISITSIRKSVPLIHGALLYISPNCRLNIFGKQGFKFGRKENSLKYLSQYLRRSVMKLNVFPVNQIKKKSLTDTRATWGNSANIQPDPFMDVRLNRYVPTVVRLLNYDRLYRNKMRNFERIIKFLDVQDFFRGRLLIGETSHGNLPLQVPFLLEEKNRDKGELLTHLKTNGIEASYWPDLPQEVVDNRKKYPVANYLKDNIIHFSI